MEVHIDFETASRKDIKEVGAYNYCADESTHILCCAFSLPQSSIELLCWESFNERQIDSLYDLAHDQDVIFVAHNAQFEKDVFDLILTPRYGFPEVPINRWRCTMAKAYYHSLPGSLAACGEALGIEQKKNPAGKRLLDKLSNPKSEKRGFGFWTPHDSHSDFDELYKYCKQDVRAEMEIDSRLMNLPGREQKLWELDWEINRRGLHVDLKVVDKVIELKNKIVGGVVEEFRNLTDLNPTQRAKFKEFLKSLGFDVPDMQAPTLKKLIESESTPDDLKYLLKLYSQANLTSLAKFEQMKNRADAGGVIREAFQYHGAHTGRWAGRGVQFQNMKRPDENVDISICLEALLALEFEEFEEWYGS